MMAMTISSQALNYDFSRREALFLSDKMAYELRLSNAQYNAVYEINLDYFLSISLEDAYGIWWRQRNYEMQNVLNPRQYDDFVRLTYFYRPVSWRNGRWHFSIYSRYSDRRYYYRGRPGVYTTYRGGRYFGPNRPADARRAGPGPRVRRDARGRVVPPRSNNLRGPAPGPNRNMRGDGPRPNEFRGNGAPPPRQGVRTTVSPDGTRRMDTGTRRLPPSGKVTRNGMVQRVGGTTRTQVTVRPDPNQQQRQAASGNGNRQNTNRNGNRQNTNRNSNRQRPDRR